MKTPLYCHSQHRNLAQLRRLEPDPVAELSRETAASRAIRNGDWLVITTPHGRVRARARLNTTLAHGIVAAQHGWWQSCSELHLPGYDALDPDGVNINLAIGVDAADPVSGAASHRCYPCQIGSWSETLSAMTVRHPKECWLRGGCWDDAPCDALPTSGPRLLQISAYRATELVFSSRPQGPLRGQLLPYRDPGISVEMLPSAVMATEALELS